MAATGINKEGVTLWCD